MSGNLGTSLCGRSWDLQFQQEVRPLVRILETDKEYRRQTLGLRQPQATVHIGSLVAEKDLGRGLVAAY